MRKCFVDVGLVKNTEGNYTKYTNHRRGTIIKKADVDGATCLGEVAAELEMVQRAGADSDDEGAASEEEEEEGRRKWKRRRRRRRRSRESSSVGTRT